jgi:hypothetical protein
MFRNQMMNQNFKNMLQVKSIRKTLTIVPFMMGIMMVSSSAFADHNKCCMIEKNVDEVALEQAIEELDEQFNQEIVALENYGTTFKFFNENEDLIYEEKVFSTEKASKKLKSMIRKSDFLLEAYDTVYYRF